MKKNFGRQLWLKGALICSGLFLIVACGGGQTTKTDTTQPLTETQLNKKYTTVRLQDTEIDPKVAADYPAAVTDYENSLLSELRLKNRFREVDKQAQPVKSKLSALYIKSKITSLRIVSGSTRFWFGAAAGTSDMIVEIKLIDSKTGNVLREKTLSTANNPFGAVFAAGSSDKSLPVDMGKIVAMYVLTIMPEK